MTETPDAPTRFNEDKATYTVRGAGVPDLELGIAAIRAVARKLPLRPGVYRMLDARGDVLYVGKARTLKNRVTSYTQPARLTKRLQRMVAQARSMEIVTTNTEAEALLLEAQLIKRYRPPYNVLLRDDKSFPFILLREDHAFPRVQLHRGARKIKGQYYGPFASAGSVRKTLTALQKLFLLRSCTDSFFANRSRPCLLYQIRRCSAPCVDRIDVAGYAELVGDAEDFLGGKSTKVQEKLSRQMAAAADAMDYELAAVYRDRLRSLTYIQGTQTIQAEGLGDADIFALACKGGTMCIQAFFIRGGQNWGARSFFPPTPRTCRKPRCWPASSPILRGSAAAAHDSARPRGARDRAARRSLQRPRRAQGHAQRPATRRSGADDRPGRRNAGERARPPPRRDQHPGTEPARPRRTVRTRCAAGADRGL